MSDNDHNHDHDPKIARLRDAAAAGCEESRFVLSRRAWLGMSAGLFSWAFMPRIVHAAPVDEPRLLVVILRGGMDGLNMAVPLNEYARYEDLRGSLAIPKIDLKRLNTAFGLNPVMGRFYAMYQARQAAIVHAVAPPLRTRSHFDCQDNLENGQPAVAGIAKVGWLNRLLDHLPQGNAVKARGGLMPGRTPLILAGPAPVMAWAPARFKFPTESFNTVLSNLYAQTAPDLQAAFNSGLRTDALARAGTAGAIYTDLAPSPLQMAFRGAGSLLANDSGPRIAVLDVDGWDTHANEKVVLTETAAGLDAALDDFRIAAGASWNKTVVVCVTEFGRTAKSNGSGTDHGTGTVALLAGGAVAGGQVFGEWPGIGATDLLEGRDLKAPNDLRSVFKGVLRDHLDVSPAILNSVFPNSGSAAPMNGLIKSTVT